MIGCINDKEKNIYILKNKNYNIYCPNIQTHHLGV